MKTFPATLTILRCISCRADSPAIRLMTALEIERVGYEPEDLRVCCECESIYDTLLTVEVEL